MWKQMTVGLLLVLLCGCLKTKDELTINADGSGKVHIETQSNIPPELVGGLQGGMGGMGGFAIYPPTSEAEARKFFPGNDFKVTVTQQKGANDEVTTVIEAEFTSLRALLASPYGRAHQLSVTMAGGSLVVKGVTGMEAAARYAEMKDDSGMGLGMMSGLADLQKKKGEMRAEFCVTLPNGITTTNGVVEGKTATWIVERAKCKDADDFARQLGTVSEARCPAEGLKPVPAGPVRMGLLPFGELAGGVAEAGPAVDTNQIAAAAKFVPYGVTVTRTLDLSGNGDSQENEARLIGAVMLPREFTPQRWGEQKLEEAVDAKGNDLKPTNPGMASRYSGMENMENGDDEAEATNNLKQHVVTLGFRPPDWKINEIARIKGSLSLQYFGGSQVVKLTNAIPAKWLMDPEKMMGGGGFDQSEKPLNSPELAATGLSVALQMGMLQSGMTVLMLQVKGAGSALTDAQVFDADGRPWPTFLQAQDFGMGDSGSCQIMVTGQPRPPLSLALQASGGVTAVTVPILVEHVPLSK